MTFDVDIVMRNVPIDLWKEDSVEDTEFITIRKDVIFMP